MLPVKTSWTSAMTSRGAEGNNKNYPKDQKTDTKQANLTTHHNFRDFLCFLVCFFCSIGYFGYDSLSAPSLVEEIADVRKAHLAAGTKIAKMHGSRSGPEPYIHMYVCVCLYRCFCGHVSMYMCKCVYVHLCLCVYICICIYTDILHVYLSMYV